jgi:hypothetical protein
MVPKTPNASHPVWLSHATCEQCAAIASGTPKEPACAAATDEQHERMTPPQYTNEFVDDDWHAVNVGKAHACFK